MAWLYVQRGYGWVSVQYVLAVLSCFNIRSLSAPETPRLPESQVRFDYQILRARYDSESCVKESRRTCHTTRYIMHLSA